MTVQKTLKSMLEGNERLFLNTKGANSEIFAFRYKSYCQQQEP
jgi:hypothetical protein